MSNPDEIDIGLIYLKISNVIKRYFVFTIFCALIGLFAGYFFFKTTKPTYESSMILQNELFNLPNGSSLVTLLNDLIRDKNYDQLSERLNMTKEQVRAIVDINVNNLYKELTPEEEIKVFKVSVNVTETTILSDLQNGLINYLEQNPYVRKRIDLKKEGISDQIAYIKDDLQGIERLKSQILNGDLLSDKSSDLLLFDPASVYQESIRLFEKEVELRTALQLAENFHVIQEFTVFQNPSSPRLSSNMGIGLFIGLVPCAIVVFFLEFRRYIKRLKLQREFAEQNV